MAGSSLCYAIGLMSGTSVDALDGVLIAFEEHFANLQVLSFASEKFNSSEKKRILKNMQDQTSSVSEICELNVALSHKAARVVKKLLQKAKLAAHEVFVIGFHGQTLYHRPFDRMASTYQIGDGPTLSYLTQIPVVNNFRTKDMAAGGQGAPLVPFAHRVLFGAQKNKIAFHNLGGISNLTYLSDEKILGFDTGPANMLLDGLMQALFKKSFDKNGQTARKGKIHAGLLGLFSKHSFFKKAPPKSTGREVFGQKYVEQWLKQAKLKKVAKTDVIATATHFTAQSIVRAYRDFVLPFGLEEIVFCGGGAFNSYLLELIAHELNVKMSTSKDYGYDPQTIEAICFAILAYLGFNRQPNQLSALTGAKSDLSLGQISYPD